MDDEILYREALLRGLDVGDPVIAGRLSQNAEFLDLGTGEAAAGAARELGLQDRDVVIRRRMIERMRAVIEAPSWAEVPSDEELEAYRAAHPGPVRGAASGRVSSRVLRGLPARGPGRGRAAALAASRASGEPPAGDPAFARREQPLQSEAELARFFGSAFAAALFDEPEGVWSGPLSVPGGSALVRIHDSRPARAPSVSEARSRLQGALQRERADAAVRAFLAERRSAYAVSSLEPPRP